MAVFETFFYIGASLGLSILFFLVLPSLFFIRKFSK